LVAALPGGIEPALADRTAPDAKVIGSCAVLCAAIFLGDLRIPLGVAGGVPYVLPTLIASWSSERRHILYFAAAGSVLTVLGYFLSPEGGVPWMVLANRGLALFAISVTAGLAYRRKRSEAALVHSEAQVRLLLDSTAEAIYGIDDRGYCTFCNPACVQMLGFDSDRELLGRHMHDLIHHSRPDGTPYPGKECRIQRAFRRGEGSHVDGEVLWRKDGTSFPVEYWSHPVRRDGHVVGAVVAFLDITERHRAEKRIQEAQDSLEQRVRDRTVNLQVANKALENEIAERERSEAARKALGDELGHKNFQLDMALDNMGHSLAMFDAELRLVICNRSYVNLFSLPKELGRPGTPLSAIIAFAARHQKLDQEARDKIHQRRTALARGREERIFREYFSDGRVIKIFHRPLADGGSLAIYEDITERLRDKKELEAATEQAELANRSKSEFLANMSHELRTPLNAVIGFSEMIRGGMYGPVGDAKYVEYAEDINTSGQHLLELINDILDLSKIEAGKLDLQEQVMGVAGAVNACLTVVRERAHGAGLQLERRLPESLPGLWADERKVKQMVLNLLANAIKFTERAGKVTVEAEVGGDGGVAIRISDSGIGIAADDLARIMEPFAQADTSLNRRHQGTGLGLPLTKALVEMHGGVLELESEPGVGTTATLRFPPERMRNAAA
jgi:PAS domain S-box-containing protein